MLAADYKFAGLEYYGECFCGMTVNGVQTSQSQCTYACTGDSSETCGGYDILSVYMDPTFQTVNSSTISDYQPLGCYTEGSNGRALAYQQSLDSSTMTTELCLQACKTANYPLAGTEYGGQ